MTLVGWLCCSQLPNMQQSHMSLLQQHRSHRPSCTGFPWHTAEENNNGWTTRTIANHQAKIDAVLFHLSWLQHFSELAAACNLSNLVWMDQNLTDFVHLRRKLTHVQLLRLLVAPDWFMTVSLNVLSVPGAGCCCCHRTCSCWSCSNCTICPSCCCYLCSTV